MRVDLSAMSDGQTSPYSKIWEGREEGSFFQVREGDADIMDSRWNEMRIGEAAMLFLRASSISGMPRLQCMWFLASLLFIRFVRRECNLPIHRAEDMW